MKRFLIFFSLLVCAVPLSAQENLNAVVLEDEEVFTMDSPVSGTFHVVRRVRVLNDAGLEDASFLEYTDAFRKLTSFRGSLEKNGGKPLKIKQDDLTTVSIGSGLAEDGFVCTYTPAGAYPFTVTYDYTVSYRKGIASFPAFFPVSWEKTRLDKGSYTLIVPAGSDIRTTSYLAGEVQRQTEGKTDRYCWTLPPFEGYTEEALMPSLERIVPHVMACPAEFTYAGSKGNQASWEDVGRWAYALKEGTDDLPQPFVEQIRQLTASCGNDLEKIRLLYDYLRDNTRYVSIQLGIGGYKPFPASQVQKTGFGDCKGLSNFMQAMLKAVGIDSYYTILNTHRAPFIPDYAGIGQMNHAMLCVPLPEKQDTLWLECTNPSVPLGYRHDDVAGHDVVLITGEGGVPVRVPSYGDTLNREIRELTVDLSDDGSAAVSARLNLYTGGTEGWTGIRTWKPETARSHLTAGLKIQPQEVQVTSVRDNFRDYDGPSYCPWMEIGYTFLTRQYATSGTNRLFVPVNPYPKDLPLQRGQRKNDLECSQGAIVRDRILLRLPDGYAPESIPAPVFLDTEWGTFRAETSVENGQITILHEFRIKRFREKAERYGDYRSFVRAVNKAYGASLVLVKSD